MMKLTVDESKQSDGQIGQLGDKICRLRLPTDSRVSDFHQPVEPLGLSQIFSKCLHLCGVYVK